MTSFRPLPALIALLALPLVLQLLILPVHISHGQIANTFALLTNVTLNYNATSHSHHRPSKQPSTTPQPPSSKAPT